MRFGVSNVVWCIVGWMVVGTASAGGWVYGHEAASNGRALTVADQQSQSPVLCRVAWRNAMYPGLVMPGRQSCRILQDGKVRSKARYQVYLTTPSEHPAVWKADGFGGIPKQAWAIGWLPDDRPVPKGWLAKDQSLYVCRVQYRGQMYFGVVSRVRNGVCDTFGVSNTEDFHHYDVLTLKRSRYAHVWR
jgi:hypothetical protein